MITTYKCVLKVVVRCFYVLLSQRDWALADGRVPAAPPAGRQQMHPDHEDGPLGDAVDGLPQPEIQHRQSDRCEQWRCGHVNGCSVLVMQWEDMKIETCLHVTVRWCNLNTMMTYYDVIDNGEELLHPYRLMPLFSGGTFDKKYNKKYQPIKFPVPASTKKVTRMTLFADHPPC